MGYQEVGPKICATLAHFGSVFLWGEGGSSYSGFGVCRFSSCFFLGGGGWVASGGFGAFGLLLLLLLLLLLIFLLSSFLVFL